VLFEDPPRIAVGTRSPWARRRKVALSELVDEPWTLTSDRVIHELVGEAFRSQGLEPPKETVSASSMLLRSRLLATGRYLTVLPDSVLRFNARQWSLKALPVDLGMKPMCVTLVTLKNRTLSPVVSLLMDEVRALAASTMA
jgi:DNA-binding transcriptional LysR family regulator